jgi:hypothetical protein
LVLYPNPANSIVTIVSPVTPIETIMVYSFTGRQVLQKEVSENQTTIDVSGFATGMYFVRVTSKNASTVVQILKN